MASLFFVFNKGDRQLKSSLKNILGFSPRNLALYHQAFRHNSVAKEIKDGIKDSNERLEFLGDAILNAVVADFLFQRFPYKDEGFLTKMRSKIVSREHLNQLAVKLGLDKLVEQSQDPGLKFSSMYGDAFEALIGAIYLDKKFYAAEQFIVKNILKFHIDLEKLETTDTDFKSKLIEWAQREKKEIHFRLMEESGDGRGKQYKIAAMISGEIFGEALHFSKKKAEQRAAENACTQLGIA